MDHPLLLSGHRWVFRGYNTLDDFVNNTNCLYEAKDCPKKKQGKYVYILSKYFFDEFVPKEYWNRYELSKQFKDVTFIYECHQDDVNIDYRWFEVMRRRKRGVYIKDVAPLHFRDKPYNGIHTPTVIAGSYPIYDKWDGKPFNLYGFDNVESPYRKFPDNERDIDVLFIGKSTSRRDEYLKKIKKVARKLNINAVISEKHVSFKKHIKLMRRSKISYHFMALGYRSSREWESMINGALLISDDRTVDNVITPGIKVNRDFIKFDPIHTLDQIAYWIKSEDERNSICRNAFKAAWKMWDGCTDSYMPSRRFAAKYIKKENC